jgi:hypothetical protein
MHASPLGCCSCTVRSRRVQTCSRPTLRASSSRLNNRPRTLWCLLSNESLSSICLAQASTTSHCLLSQVLIANADFWGQDTCMEGWLAGVVTTRCCRVVREGAAAVAEAQPALQATVVLAEIFEEPSLPSNQAWLGPVAGAPFSSSPSTSNGTSKQHRQTSSVCALYSISSRATQAALDPFFRASNPARHPSVHAQAISTTHRCSHAAVALASLQPAAIERDSIFANLLPWLSSNLSLLSFKYLVYACFA